MVGGNIVLHALSCFSAPGQGLGQEAGPKGHPTGEVAVAIRRRRRPHGPPPEALSRKENGIHCRRSEVRNDRERCDAVTSPVRAIR